MSLKFKCPSCDSEDLEVVQTDVVMTSKVVDIDEDACLGYDLIDFDGGSVDRFQCHKCGYVIKDKYDENITADEDVVEWIKDDIARRTK